METDDNTILISALQHYLFCPRQYALIHLEQVWAENRLTAEGQVMHRNAHEGKDESRPGVRITRGLKIGSEKWGIRGVCDVIEFHGKAPNYQAVVPVEYKRGKPKPHRADELQLCAQAVCLEEMIHLSVPKGFLFYGKTRRRTEVAIDRDLRELLRVTLLQIRSLCDTGKTPTAVFEPTKCKACSLLELCMPDAMRLKRGVKSWFVAELARCDNPFKPDN